jgi:hypothetical protein
MYPIYRSPAADSSVDQGDLVEDCPLLLLASFDTNTLASLEVASPRGRVIVLTQSCDLANQKVKFALCARVIDAQSQVDQGLLKATEVRGPIRGGRVFGLYFLPKTVEFGLPEMIVDLRQLHTVRLDLLTELCRRGQRRAQLQPLYREHLAKHFADTYSRIGLPQPYETDQ